MERLSLFSSQRVVSDGKLERLLGTVLEEKEFYVDARRRERSSLFEYSASDQALAILHRSRSRKSGDCLTLTSSEGRLASSGADCEEERRPLCHRLGERFSLAKMTRLVKKQRNDSLRRWKRRSQTERHVSTCDDGGNKT